MEPRYQYAIAHIHMSISTSKAYPKIPQKEENRVLACFGVCTRRKGYVGPIRRALN
jgi:hypothetical protein